MRDSLVEDAIQPARDAGKEVDAQAYNDYIVGILEGLDHKQATQDTPAAADGVPKDRDEVTANEFERRTGRDMPSMSVDRNPESPRLVNVSHLEQVGRARLAARLRWIKQRPDLYERVKGLSIALNSSHKPTRERAALKMREFIAMTDRLAGHDWRKPKQEKLVFSG